MKNNYSMKFSRQKEEWRATLEILSDPKLTAAWRRGKKEVQSGKTDDWEAVKQRPFTSKGRILDNKR